MVAALCPGPEPLADARFGFRNVQAIERNIGVVRVDCYTFAGISIGPFSGGRFCNQALCAQASRLDGCITAIIGKVELFGEVEVAFVVGRHGHDCASAVTSQDVVGNVNRNLLTVDWVERIGTSENAGLFFDICLAFQFAFVCRLGDVSRLRPSVVRLW